jgi:adenine/guanine phosphoribosyltransferase-like PRPP-binding protein
MRVLYLFEEQIAHETISATYDLEYGTDNLEIHADAIQRRPNPLYMMMF